MNEIIKRVTDAWANPATRPLFKGKLIDADGCCCAQGYILRCELQWDDAKIRNADQTAVDKLIAKTLGISTAHAILLRQINDQKDGCPQDVLTTPEKILGENAQAVLAFWRHLDEMTPERWDAARAAARAAAGAAARDAARAAARAAAGAAARDAAWDAARAAAGDAAGAAAWDAARAAAGATYEIMGVKFLALQGRKPFFLPMFGFALSRSRKQNHPKHRGQHERAAYTG